MTEPRVATLDNIRTPKTKLINTLRENRERHKEEFDDSLSGYFDAVAQEITTHMRQQVASFERNIERAHNEDEATRTAWTSFCVTVAKPTDHTDDYDRAIVRLEWEIATEVDLDAEEFDSYVLNKWPWIQKHITSVMSFASQHLANYRR